jgi:hypothetical protein
VAEHEGVFYLKITAKPGDVIRRPPDGNNVLGGIGVADASLDDALRTATDLAGKIEVRMVGDR